MTQTISHLNNLDWIIIAIYFLFMFGLGYAVKRHTTSGKDFFLAGRRNSAWVAGLAFLSANMGALEILGMSGQSFQYGIMPMHFYLIGAIPAMLFLAVFMMPFYYSSKIHSVPEYLRQRFNDATRSLNAIAFAIMTLLMSGINMYAMALVLHIFVGWNFNASIWISSITVACYISLGGLTSAIFSEVLQFFLIWFGLLLAVILGYLHIGGSGAITARLSHAYLHLWSTTGHYQNNSMLVDWFSLVFGLGFILSFGYWTTDFLVIQRAFSAKDLREARLTPIIASFFKMLLPIIVILPGLLVLVMVHNHEVPQLPRSDDALLYLMAKVYNHGLLGLGVTALLAAFMSGQAGNISAFNTVFTYDIYRGFLYKNADDQHYLKVGRIVTILGVMISILTAYWAMSMPSIMEYMQALFSIVNAPLFATILLGMFWKRMNGIGAFIGLLTGMLTSATMFLLVEFHYVSAQTFTLAQSTSPMVADFWRAIWAWGITFGLTIIISLCTTAQPVESLKGLVYSREKMVTPHMAIYKRPVFWAIISAIILVLLNILFW